MENNNKCKCNDSHCHCDHHAKSICSDCQDKNTLESENTFLVPVSWTEVSTVAVKGVKTAQEAVNIVKSNIDDIPLPSSDMTLYLDNSYKVDIETDEDLENAQFYKTIGVEIEVNNNNIKISRI